MFVWMVNQPYAPQKQTYTYISALNNNHAPQCDAVNTLVFIKLLEHPTYEGSLILAVVQITYNRDIQLHIFGSLICQGLIPVSARRRRHIL